MAFPEAVTVQDKGNLLGTHPTTSIAFGFINRLKSQLTGAQCDP